MAGITRQIIGSFEDLGKQIGSEVVKVPKEIAGKALESLGGTSQKGQNAQTPSPAATGEVSKPRTPLDELDKTKDQKTREAIAHNALQYLAEKRGQKVPSVWEQTQKEEEAKKAHLAKQAAQAAVVAPVFTPSKPKSGYGIAQKASAEKSRNVRQD